MKGEKQRDKYVHKHEEGGDTEARDREQVQTEEYDMSTDSVAKRDDEGGRE